MNMCECMYYVNMILEQQICMYVYTVCMCVCCMALMTSMCCVSLVSPVFDVHLARAVDALDGFIAGYGVQGIS